MLDTGTTVELTELSNLRLSEAISRLVDRHLNFFIKISHDDGSEGRVFGVNLLIIYRPESVEVEHLFVPLSNGFHFTIRLVSDAMVDGLEIGDGEHFVKAFNKSSLLVTREERSGVVYTLYERMDSISVSLNRGDNNFTIFVF